jgi:hypothetical protein
MSGQDSIENRNIENFSCEFVSHQTGRNFIIMCVVSLQKFLHLQVISDSYQIGMKYNKMDWAWIDNGPSKL